MGNYKIIRLAGMHSKAAMDSLYSKHPGLENASYARQQQALFENAYMYSDSFSKEMRKLGHWAEEIVHDVKPLQMKWMEERGVKVDVDDWQSNIILAQLEYFRPDIVFFQDIHALSYELKSSLKKRIPSIKKIIIFRGFPGVDHKLFKELALADLLLVGSPILVDKCQAQGLKPHLMYHYFDSSIIHQLEKESLATPSIDFSFVGSSGYGYEAHRDRYHMLLELLQKTKIELWIDEPHERMTIKSCLAKGIKFGFNLFGLETLKTLRTYPVWPGKICKFLDESIEQKLFAQEPNQDHFRPASKPLRRLFPSRCKAPLFGLDMFRVLQQSKVVLNKHSMPAQGTVDNIRLFQATGVGSCLLTDTGSNMVDLFEPDREVVTYSGFEECLEKYRYLLENEKVASQISVAGQKRTLKDHTSAVRCSKMNELIEKMMSIG